MEGTIPSISETGEGPAATAAKHTGLLDLSLDVLVHVLSFLQPGDIISASKVCKPLRTCGSQHSVWIDVLRHVCEQQRVFPPTFEPMEELSLLELRRAATSHLRLLEHVKRCSSKGYIPRVATRIMDDSAHASVEDARFEHITLVPGGRFLVTCARDLVQLWDLGISANSIIGPCAIASLTVEEESIGTSVCCEIVTVHPTSDNRGLRAILMVGNEEISDEYKRYDVCEVYPLRETQFRIIASARIEQSGTTGEDCIQWCTRNEIIILAGDVFIAWNYVSDTWIKWESNPGVFYHQFYSCNDCIIAIADGSIAVFAMPALQPRVPNEQPHIIMHKPMYRLVHREDAQTTYIVSDPWGARTPPDEISNYVDIIHHTDGGCALDHYIFHRIDIPGSSSPTVFPAHMHEVQIPNAQMSNHGGAKINWITPLDMLMLYKTDSFLAARLWTLPAADGEPVAQYPECRMWLAGEDGYVFNYCNFSGRVCIRDNIRLGEIRIIDYLP